LPIPPYLTRIIYSAGKKMQMQGRKQGTGERMGKMKCILVLSAEKEGERGCPGKCLAFLGGFLSSWHFFNYGLNNKHNAYLRDWRCGSIGRALG
jgi:hypothetical protein